MVRRFAVFSIPEPDGPNCNVTVPAFPGCVTWGTTVDEAPAMPGDAVETFLEGEPAAEWPGPAGIVAAEVDVPIVEHHGQLAREPDPLRASA